MSGNPFFSPYPQKEVDIRGAAGKSPMFFRDFHMMGGVFTADLDGLRRLLPRGWVGRRPLRLPGRRGLLAIHCMEYRDTDIGPYNEISISVPVKRGWLPALSVLQLARSVGMREYHAFVAELPVTTETALHGGLDFFNYPKYLADITFRETAAHRVATLRDKETLDVIVELEGRKVPAPRSKHPDTMTLYTYPEIDGRAHRVKLLVNQLERGGAYLRRGASLRFGPHPKAERLRELRLGRQVQYLYAPRCEAVLFEPEAA